MFSSYILIIAAFLVSSLCGFVAIPHIMNFCQRKKLYDIPNERKVHSNAVPRLGGIIFLPSMFVAFVIAIFMLSFGTTDRTLTFSTWTAMFFISLLLIYVVGLIDDVMGLSATTKFIVQIVAASLLPFSGLYLNTLYGFCGIHEIPFWVGAPLTVFLVVAVDNAMNLIDGIDGLAGGLSVLSLCGFLYAFHREGMVIYCILIAGLIGVLISFLYFNIFGKVEHNRKIFMGDAGSLTIGFILGFLLVKYAMHNPRVMPFRRDGLLLSFTLLIVPLFDLARVIFYRMRHHQPLFGADRSHIHHKFLRAGCSQHGALICILSLSLAFMVLNLLLAYVADFDLTGIVAVDVALFVGGNLLLNVLIRRRESAQDQQSDAFKRDASRP